MQTVTAGAERLFDYGVIDAAGNRIGDVDNIWVDQATGQPAFFGAKAAGFLGGTYVLPLTTASVDDNQRVVVLPYTLDAIKHAPALSAGDELTAEDERRISDYYSQVAAPGYGSAMPAGAAAGAVGAAAAGVAAAEARGREVKRAVMGQPQYQGPIAAAPGAAPMAAQPASSTQQVSGSGPDSVRLRKVIRTERVYVPVDVQREYVEVDGQPANNQSSVAQASERMADRAADRADAAARDATDRPPFDGARTVPLDRPTR